MFTMLACTKREDTCGMIVRSREHTNWQALEPCRIALGQGQARVRCAHLSSLTQSITPKVCGRFTNPHNVETTAAAHAGTKDRIGTRYATPHGYNTLSVWDSCHPMSRLVEHQQRRSKTLTKEHVLSCSDEPSMYQ